ncbi:MAG: PDZ domain-containing protein, partial [Acidobacteria bacterium]
MRPTVKQPQRAPWWVFAIAGAFISFYALLLYCDLNRPADEGFHLRPTARGLAVESVHAGSPAEAAGIRTGDVVSAADGRPVSSRLDWSTVSGNVRFGTPTRLTVVRGDRELRLDIGHEPATWRHWTTRQGAGLLISRAVQFVALALGVVILGRRRDAVARLGAWVLGSFGVFYVVVPYRFFAVWRGLPALGREALWLPFASTTFIPALLLSFFLSFPVRRVRSPWGWALLWLPLIVAAGPYFRFQGTVLYAPQAA